MAGKKKRKALSRRRFLELTGAAAVASVIGPRALASELRGTSRIVRAAIHPAIGVARVGDSEAVSIGPEVVEPLFTDSGQSRDAQGALKRQAARFRVYGYDAEGRVVRELTAAEADIEWTVHVANRKAQWYRFLAPLDLPEAKDMSVPRRNPDVQGAAREALAIDPGPRIISGRSRSGMRFDGGKFQGVPVSLGELRTDSQGRLLVLSGLGKSGSPKQTSVFDPKDWDTFNNADGWYDDLSDGPVRAKVTVDGRELQVESAWVIVAPPNYAPDIIGWRTLHDLLVDTYVAAGMMPEPATTSFTRDVLPIFRRLSNLQWVNKGFADVFGRGTVSDFDDPAIVARLADPTQDGLHQRIYDFFRHASKDPSDRRLWPMIYGDGYGTFPRSASENLQVTGLLDLHLKRWSEGKYVNDWDPEAKPARRLAEVPVEEQPEMLDRAALHFCLADAFHPGCELTWPMRHASLFRAPFRIRERAAGAPEPDYGDTLSRESVLGPQGPLQEQGPGGLTRWMALPWQGDTAFCRSGYDPEFDPYLPTFWAARVPNQVLSAEDYAIAIDASRPRAERIAAFKRRVNWVQPIFKLAPVPAIHAMVSGFGRMGVVEARPGVKDDPDLPAVMFVQSMPPDLAQAAEAPGTFGTPPPMTESVPAPGRGGPKTVKPPKTPEQKRLEDAGWDSQEQLEAFRNIFGRKKP